MSKTPEAGQPDYRISDASLYVIACVSCIAFAAIYIWAITS